MEEGDRWGLSAQFEFSVDDSSKQNFRTVLSQLTGIEQAVDRLSETMGSTDVGTQISRSMTQSARSTTRASTAVDQMGDSFRVAQKRLDPLKREFRALQKEVRLVDFGELTDDRQFKRATTQVKTYIQSLKALESQVQGNTTADREFIATLLRQEKVMNSQLKMQELQRDASKAQSRVGEFSFLKDAGQTVFNDAVVTQGKDAIALYSRFDDTMSSVSATVGVTGEQLDTLRERASLLGATTRYTAQEAAEAEVSLGTAGFKTKQILTAVNSTLNLASAGQLDLAEATKITTDSLFGFRLETDQVGHVTDVFARASADSNTNIQQLGLAMSYASAPAKVFGASIEETSALIGVMSNAGIAADKAGTASRGAFLKLAAPTAAGNAALAEFGIQLTDSSGDMRNIIDILGEFSTKLQIDPTALKSLQNAGDDIENIAQVSQSKQIQALKSVFGTTSLSGVAAALGQITELNRLALANIGSSSNTEQMVQYFTQLKGLKMNEGEDIFSAVSRAAPDYQSAVGMINEANVALLKGNLRTLNKPDIQKLQQYLKVSPDENLLDAMIAQSPTADLAIAKVSSAMEQLGVEFKTKTGSAKIMALVMEDNLAGSFRALDSAMEAVSDAFIESIAPFIRGVTDSATKVALFLATLPKPLKTIISTTALLTVGVGALAVAVGTVGATLFGFQQALSVANLASTSMAASLIPLTGFFETSQDAFKGTNSLETFFVGNRTLARDFEKATTSTFRQTTSGLRLLAAQAVRTSQAFLLLARSIVLSPIGIAVGSFILLNTLLESVIPGFNLLGIVLGAIAAPIGFIFGLIKGLTIALLDFLGVSTSGGLNAIAPLFTTIGRAIEMAAQSFALFSDKGEAIGKNLGNAILFPFTFAGEKIFSIWEGTLSAIRGLLKPFADFVKYIGQLLVSFLAENSPGPTYQIREKWAMTVQFLQNLFVKLRNSVTLVNQAFLGIGDVSQDDQMVARQRIFEATIGLLNAGVGQLKTLGGVFASLGTLQTELISNSIKNLDFLGFTLLTIASLPATLIPQLRASAVEFVPELARLVNTGIPRAIAFGLPGIIAIAISTGVLKGFENGVGEFVDKLPQLGLKISQGFYNLFDADLKQAINNALSAGVTGFIRSLPNLFAGASTFTFKFDFDKSYAEFETNLISFLTLLRVYLKGVGDTAQQIGDTIQSALAPILSFQIFPAFLPPIIPWLTVIAPAQKALGELLNSPSLKGILQFLTGSVLPAALKTLWAIISSVVYVFNALVTLPITAIVQVLTTGIVSTYRKLIAFAPLIPGIIAKAAAESILAIVDATGILLAKIPIIGLTLSKAFLFTANLIIAAGPRYFNLLIRFFPIKQFKALLPAYLKIVTSLVTGIRYALSEGLAPIARLVLNAFNPFAATKLLNLYFSTGGFSKIIKPDTIGRFVTGFNYINPFDLLFGGSKTFNSLLRLGLQKEIAVSFANLKTAEMFQYMASKKLQGETARLGKFLGATLLVPIEDIIAEQPKFIGVLINLLRGMMMISPIVQIIGRIAITVMFWYTVLKPLNKEMLDAIANTKVFGISLSPVAKTLSVMRFIIVDLGDQIVGFAKQIPGYVRAIQVAFDVIGAVIGITIHQLVGISSILTNVFKATIGNFLLLIPIGITAALDVTLIALRAMLQLLRLKTQQYGDAIVALTQGHFLPLFKQIASDIAGVVSFVIQQTLGNLLKAVTIVFGYMVHLARETFAEIWRFIRDPIGEIIRLLGLLRTWVRRVFGDILDSVYTVIKQLQLDKLVRFVRDFWLQLGAVADVLLLIYGIITPYQFALTTIIGLVVFLVNEYRTGFQNIDGLIRALANPIEFLTNALQAMVGLLNVYIPPNLTEFIAGVAEQFVKSLPLITAGLFIVALLIKRDVGGAFNLVSLGITQIIGRILQAVAAMQNLGTAAKDVATSTRSQVFFGARAHEVRSKSTIAGIKNPFAYSQDTDQQERASFLGAQRVSKLSAAAKYQDAMNKKLQEVEKEILQEYRRKARSGNVSDKSAVLGGKGQRDDGFSYDIAPSLEKRKNRFGIESYQLTDLGKGKAQDEAQRRLFTSDEEKYKKLRADAADKSGLSTSFKIYDKVDKVSDTVLQNLAQQGERGLKNVIEDFQRAMENVHIKTFQADSLYVKLFEIPTAALGKAAYSPGAFDAQLAMFKKTDLGQTPSKKEILDKTPDSSRIRDALLTTINNSSQPLSGGTMNGLLTKAMQGIIGETELLAGTISTINGSIVKDGSAGFIKLKSIAAELQRVDPTDISAFEQAIQEATIGINKFQTEALSKPFPGSDSSPAFADFSKANLQAVQNAARSLDDLPAIATGSKAITQGIQNLAAQTTDLAQEGTRSRKSLFKALFGFSGLPQIVEQFQSNRQTLRRIQEVEGRTNQLANRNAQESSLAAKLRERGLKAVFANAGFNYVTEKDLFYTEKQITDKERFILENFIKTRARKIDVSASGSAFKGDVDEIVGKFTPLIAGFSIDSVDKLNQFHQTIISRLSDEQKDQFQKFIRKGASKNPVAGQISEIDRDQLREQINSLLKETKVKDALGLKTNETINKGIFNALDALSDEQTTNILANFLRRGNFINDINSDIANFYGDIQTKLGLGKKGGTPLSQIQKVGLNNPMDQLQSLIGTYVDDFEVKAKSLSQGVEKKIADLEATLAGTIIGPSLAEKIVSPIRAFYKGFATGVENLYSAQKANTVGFIQNIKKDFKSLNLVSSVIKLRKQFKDSQTNSLQGLISQGEAKYVKDPQGKINFGGQTYRNDGAPEDRAEMQGRLLRDLQTKQNFTRPDANKALLTVLRGGQIQTEVKQMLMRQGLSEAQINQAIARVGVKAKYTVAEVLEIQGLNVTKIGKSLEQAFKITDKDVKDKILNNVNFTSAMGSPIQLLIAKQLPKLLLDTTKDFVNIIGNLGGKTVGKFAVFVAKDLSFLFKSGLLSKFSDTTEALRIKLALGLNKFAQGVDNVFGRNPLSAIVNRLADFISAKGSQISKFFGNQAAAVNTVGAKSFSVKIVSAVRGLYEIITNQIQQGTSAAQGQGFFSKIKSAFGNIKNAVLGLFRNPEVKGLDKQIAREKRRLSGGQGSGEAYSPEIQERDRRRNEVIQTRLNKLISQREVAAKFSPQKMVSKLGGVFTGVSAGFDKLTSKFAQWSSGVSSKSSKSDRRVQISPNEAKSWKEYGSEVKNGIGFYTQQITPLVNKAFSSVLEKAGNVTTKLSNYFRGAALRSQNAWEQSANAITGKSWWSMVKRAVWTGTKIVFNLNHGAADVTKQAWENTQQSVTQNMGEIATTAAATGKEINQQMQTSAQKSVGFLGKVGGAIGGVGKAGLAVGGAVTAVGFGLQTAFYSLSTMGIVSEETSQQMSKFFEIFTLLGAVGGIATPIVAALAQSLGAIGAVSGAVISGVTGIGGAIAGVIGLGEVAFAPMLLGIGAVVIAIAGLLFAFKTNFLGIRSIAQGAANFLGQVFAAPISFIQNAWQRFVDGFGSKLMMIIQPALNVAQGLINALNHNPTEAIPLAWEGMQERIGGVFNWMGDTAKSVGSAVGGFFAPLGNLFSRKPPVNENTIAPNDEISDTSKEKINQIATALTGDSLVVAKVKENPLQVIFNSLVDWFKGLIASLQLLTKSSTVVGDKLDVQAELLRRQILISQAGQLKSVVNFARDKDRNSKIYDFLLRRQQVQDVRSRLQASPKIARLQNSGVGKKLSWLGGLVNTFLGIQGGALLPLLTSIGSIIAALGLMTFIFTTDFAGIRTKAEKLAAKIGSIFGNAIEMITNAWKGFVGWFLSMPLVQHALDMGFGLIDALNHNPTVAIPLAWAGAIALIRTSLENLLGHAGEIASKLIGFFNPDQLLAKFQGAISLLMGQSKKLGKNLTEVDFQKEPKKVGGVKGASDKVEKFALYANFLNDVAGLGGIALPGFLDPLLKITTIVGGFGDLTTEILPAMFKHLSLIKLSFLSFVPAIGAIVAGLGILYFAWNKNLFGIRSATVGAIATLTTAWAGFFNWFSNLPLVGVGIQWGIGLINALNHSPTEAIPKAWEGATGAISGMIEGLVGVAQSVGGAISGVLSPVGNFFSNKKAAVDNKINAAKDRVVQTKDAAVDSYRLFAVSANNIALIAEFTSESSFTIADLNLTTFKILNKVESILSVIKGEKQPQNNIVDFTFNPQPETPQVSGGKNIFSSLFGDKKLQYQAEVTKQINSQLSDITSEILEKSNSKSLSTKSKYENFVTTTGESGSKQTVLNQSGQLEVEKRLAAMAGKQTGIFAQNNLESIAQKQGYKPSEESGSLLDVALKPHEAIHDALSEFKSQENSPSVEQLKILVSLTQQLITSSRYIEYLLKPKANISENSVGDVLSESDKKSENNIVKSNRGNRAEDLPGITSAGIKATGIGLEIIPKVIKEGLREVVKTASLGLLGKTEQEQKLTSISSDLKQKRLEKPLFSGRDANYQSEVQNQVNLQEQKIVEEIINKSKSKSLATKSAYEDFVTTIGEGNKQKTVLSQSGQVEVEKRLAEMAGKQTGVFAQSNLEAIAKKKGYKTDDKSGSLLDVALKPQDAIRDTVSELGLGEKEPDSAPLVQLKIIAGFAEQLVISLQYIESLLQPKVNIPQNITSGAELPIQIIPETNPAASLTENLSIIQKLSKWFEFHRDVQKTDTQGGSGIDIHKKTPARTDVTGIEQLQKAGDLFHRPKTIQPLPAIPQNIALGAELPIKSTTIAPEIKDKSNSAASLIEKISISIFKPLLDFFQSQKAVQKTDTGGGSGIDIHKKTPTRTDVTGIEQLQKAGDLFHRPKVEKTLVSPMDIAIAQTSNNPTESNNGLKTSPTFNSASPSFTEAESTINPIKLAWISAIATIKESWNNFTSGFNSTLNTLIAPASNVGTQLVNLLNHGAADVTQMAWERASDNISSSIGELPGVSEQANKSINKSLSHSVDGVESKINEFSTLANGFTVPKIGLDKNTQRIPQNQSDISVSNNIKNIKKGAYSALDVNSPANMDSMIKRGASAPDFIKNSAWKLAKLGADKLNIKPEDLKNKSFGDIQQTAIDSTKGSDKAIPVKVAGLIVEAYLKHKQSLESMKNLEDSGQTAMVGDIGRASAGAFELLEKAFPILLAGAIPAAVGGGAAGSAINLAMRNALEKQIINAIQETAVEKIVQGTLGESITNTAVGLTTGAALGGAMNAESNSKGSHLAKLTAKTVIPDTTASKATPTVDLGTEQLQNTANLLKKTFGKVKLDLTKGAIATDKAWDKTTNSIDTNVDSLVNTSTDQGYELQKAVSEGSPGPTYWIRENWEKTTGDISGWLGNLSGEAKKTGETINSSLTPSVALPETKVVSPLVGVEKSSNTNPLSSITGFYDAIQQKYDSLKNSQSLDFGELFLPGIKQVGRSISILGGDVLDFAKRGAKSLLTLNFGELSDAVGDFGGNFVYAMKGIMSGFHGLSISAIAFGLLSVTSISPLILVLGGILFIVAAVVSNFLGARTILAGLGKVGFGVAQMLIVGFLGVRDIISAVGQIIGGVVEGIVTGDFSKIREGFQNLGKALYLTVTGLGESLLTVFSGVRKIISGVVEGIEQIFPPLGKILRQIGKFFDTTTTSLINALGAFRQGKKAGEMFAEVLINAVKQVFTLVKGIPPTIFRIFKSAFTQAKIIIATFVEYAIEKIKGFKFSFPKLKAGTFAKIFAGFRTDIDVEVEVIAARIASIPGHLSTAIQEISPNLAKDLESWQKFFVGFARRIEQEIPVGISQGFRRGFASAIAIARTYLSPLVSGMREKFDRLWASLKADFPGTVLEITQKATTAFTNFINGLSTKWEGLKEILISGNLFGGFFDDLRSVGTKFVDFVNTAEIAWMELGEKIPGIPLFPEVFTEFRNLNTHWIKLIDNIQLEWMRVTNLIGSSPFLDNALAQLAEGIASISLFSQAFGETISRIKNIQGIEGFATFLIAEVDRAESAWKTFVGWLNTSELMPNILVQMKQGGETFTAFVHKVGEQWQELRVKFGNLEILAGFFESLKSGSAAVSNFFENLQTKLANSATKFPGMSFVQDTITQLWSLSERFGEFVIFAEEKWHQLSKFLASTELIPATISGIEFLGEKFTQTINFIHSKWEPFVQFLSTTNLFTAVFNELRNLSAHVPMFAEQIKAVFQDLPGFIGKAVDWITGKWVGFVNEFRSILQPIVDFALNIATGLINALNHNPTERIPEAWRVAIEQITGGIKSLIGVATGVADALIQAFNKASAFIEEAGKSIGNFLQPQVEKVTSAMKSLIGVATTAGDTLAQAFTPVSSYIRGVTEGIDFQSQAMRSLVVTIETLGKVFSVTYDAAKVLFTLVIDLGKIAFNVVNSVIEPIVKISQFIWQLTSAVAAFVSGFVSGFTTAVSPAVEKLLPVLGSLVPIFVRIAALVGTVVVAFEALSPVVSLISHSFNAIFGLPTELSLINVAITTITGAFAGLVGYISTFMNSLDEAKNKGEAFGEAVGWAVGKIISGITELLSLVATLGDKLTSPLKFVDTAWQKTGDRISSIWKRTTKSVQADMEELPVVAQVVGEQVEGKLTEASPGPTFMIRQNWKRTGDFVQEEMQSMSATAKVEGKNIEAAFDTSSSQGQMNDLGQSSRSVLLSLGSVLSNFAPQLATPLFMVNDLADAFFSLKEAVPGVRSVLAANGIITASQAGVAASVEGATFVIIRSSVATGTAATANAGVIGSANAYIATSYQILGNVAQFAYSKLLLPLVPFLPLIIGVAAGTFLLYQAFRNNFLGITDLVTGVVQVFGEFFGMLFSGAWNAIAGIFTNLEKEIGNIFNTLKRVAAMILQPFEPLFEALGVSNGGNGGVLATAMNVVVNLILIPLRLVAGTINFIVSALSNIIQVLIKVAGGIINFILLPFRIVGAVIAGIARGIEAFSSTFGYALDLFLLKPMLIALDVTMRVGGALAQIGLAITNFIFYPFNLVTRLLYQVLSPAISAIVLGMGALGAIAGGVFLALNPLFLIPLFLAAFGGIKFIVIGILQLISNIWGNTIGRVVGTMQGFGLQVKDIGSQLVQNLATDPLGAITRAWVAAIDAIKDALSDLGDAGKVAGGSVKSVVSGNLLGQGGAGQGENNLLLPGTNILKKPGQHIPVNTNLETLGLTSAPQNLKELKTAYRQQAQIYHPDKGGDPEKFRQVNAAYNQMKLEMESPTRATAVEQPVADIIDKTLPNRLSQLGSNVSSTLGSVGTAIANFSPQLAAPLFIVGDTIDAIFSFLETLPALKAFFFAKKVATVADAATTTTANLAIAGSEFAVAGAAQTSALSQTTGAIQSSIAATTEAAVVGGANTFMASTFLLLSTAANTAMVAIMSLGAPVLLMIAGVILVVGAIYLAFKSNFLGITDFVKRVWSAIRSVFSLIVQGIQAVISVVVNIGSIIWNIIIFPLKLIVPIIQTILQALGILVLLIGSAVLFFNAAAIFGSIVAAFSGAIALIAPVIGIITAIWSIVSAIATLVIFIAPILAGVFTSILAVGFSGIIAAIAPFIPIIIGIIAAAYLLKGAFVLVFGVVSGVLSGVWDLLGEIFGSIVTEFRNVWKVLEETGKSLVEPFEPLIALFGGKGGGGGFDLMALAVRNIVFTLLVPFRILAWLIINVIKGISLLIQGIVFLGGLLIKIILSPILLVMAAFDLIRTLLGGLGAQFSAIGTIVVNTLLAPFQAIWNYIKGIIDFATNGLSNVPVIGGFFKPSERQQPQQFAVGGLVKGEGTSTGDRIPAYLSNGEFVVNAQGTRKNLAFLNAINQGKIPTVLPTVENPPIVPLPQRTQSTPTETPANSGVVVENININFDVTLNADNDTSSGDEFMKYLEDPRFERAVRDSLRNIVERMK